ncbi:glycosyltransferase family protein [Acinetobacter stercoris]|uniref:Spore protein YkvP/CgeB glycosyl transferase-like domain-containing protein n=1 Tax=Acinetobacter stercoris TaxID=2126983 RepID=A0A2U3N419_9GAMM|nr:glycosyltransferase [Acinetobacter stercoris]SPL72430.1 hypothetical protein KPC_3608 [Acinetobacter stercoris]
MSDFDDIEIEICMGTKKRRYNDFIYFIVCPQVFKRLPPSSKMVSIQLEQCVSDWLDESYLNKLRKSKFIYDYSKKNINHLLKEGISIEKIGYFPISAILNYKDYLAEKYNYNFNGIKENDVLFYGNTNSPRRQKMLEILNQHFKVRVEENLYGYEMLKAIDESRIVINIHYYESALLETTRIYECLSMGACVVSETSIDIEDYLHLINSKQIAFFNIDDYQDMLTKVESMLAYLSSKQDVMDSLMLEQSYAFLKQTVLTSIKNIINDPA